MPVGWRDSQQFCFQKVKSCNGYWNHVWIHHHLLHNWIHLVVSEIENIEMKKKMDLQEDRILEKKIPSRIFPIENSKVTNWFLKGILLNFRFNVKMSIYLIIPFLLVVLTDSNSVFWHLLIKVEWSKLLSRAGLKNFVSVYVRMAQILVTLRTDNISSALS